MAISKKTQNILRYYSGIPLLVIGLVHVILGLVGVLLKTSGPLRPLSMFALGLGCIVLVVGIILMILGFTLKLNEDETPTGAAATETLNTLVASQIPITFRSRAYIQKTPSSGYADAATGAGNENYGYKVMYGLKFVPTTGTAQTTFSRITEIKEAYGKVVTGSPNNGNISFPVSLKSDAPAGKYSLAIAFMKTDGKWSSWVPIKDSTDVSYTTGQTYFEYSTDALFATVIGGLYPAFASGSSTTEPPPTEETPPSDEDEEGPPSDEDEEGPPEGEVPP